MRDFLGKDTAFPIQGKFQSIEGINLVNQDLQILLLTIPGERVQRPNYGCFLYSRAWDNIDFIAEQGVVDIRDAITQFEPRVQLIRVDAEIRRSEGLVEFSIQYRIIGQNTPQNLVFPFRRQVV